MRSNAIHCRIAHSPGDEKSWGRVDQRDEGVSAAPDWPILGLVVGYVALISVGILLLA